MTTIPTIGFNVETISYKNINFTVWDVGGRDKARNLIVHYYQNTQGVILCVDSNDRERLSEAKYELDRVLTAEELKACPILIFANKRDLENAMPMEEFLDKLGVYLIRNRAWRASRPYFKLLFRFD